jgi:transposase
VDHVGMDLGKRESQIAILTEDGELIEMRIRTDRHRLVELFGRRPKGKILVEASTESEWVACCLEELGHEVIVADPNYAPMYAQRTRRVKTDRRDARALAHACKLGTYRPAHRTSTQRRHLRTVLAVREAVVRTRAAWISRIQPLLRREGFRIRTGAPETFRTRLEELVLPPALKTAIAPLVGLLGPLNEQIQALDAELEQIVAADDVARRLTTTPGVGPVTAVAFVATVDDVSRFRSAHQLEAYLGLVPSEWSSSEVQRRGRITKAGNGRMRWLLVQAAWCILRRRKKAQTLALREWADRIASRRGRSIAAVALARRLAGILFAIWRDKTVYDAAKVRGAVTLTQAA